LQTAVSSIPWTSETRVEMLVIHLQTSNNLS
jgi:hypothetical protein